ncbi:MAG: cysteine--tRNA ligase, partial [Beijerinckiaceae bacterium]
MTDAKMPIQLYNTLTKRKEPFAPLDDKNVRMYVCGPTVYDEAHIGNARPVIVFDVLYRLLRHVYGEKHVTYVRNLTDIDDKINKRAFERWDKKRPLLAEIRALTEKTAAQFHADVDALGNLRPNHEPRATDYVCDGEKRTDMVRIIEKLITRGHAYAAEGHVLFDVPSMPNYGRLARRTKDDMLAGARVDVAPYKKDPMDFVLWKPSDPETEPGWASPWGFGRPGWHIECSAMSGALLGETFDIHAGGIDLIFPHHENEIAQTCCAFGVEKMASVWMHNGFLQVEGEKMSKSLGNFVTINELLRTEKFGGRSWPGEVLRLAMLKTHYRQPIDWTVRALEEALREWVSFREIVTDFLAMPEPDNEFISALADDINTPAAFARLYSLRDQAKSDVSAGRRLTHSLRLLGFFNARFALKFSISYSENEISPQGIMDASSNLTGDFPVSAIAEHFEQKYQGLDIEASKV